MKENGSSTVVFLCLFVLRCTAGTAAAAARMAANVANKMPVVGPLLAGVLMGAAEMLALVRKARANATDAKWIECIGQCYCFRGTLHCKRSSPVPQCLSTYSIESCDCGPAQLVFICCWH